MLESEALTAYVKRNQAEFIAWGREANQLLLAD